MRYMILLENIKEISWVDGGWLEKVRFSWSLDTIEWNFMDIPWWKVFFLGNSMTFWAVKKTCVMGSGALEHEFDLPQKSREDISP